MRQDHVELEVRPVSGTVAVAGWYLAYG